MASTDRNRLKLLDDIFDLRDNSFLIVQLRDTTGGQQHCIGIDVGQQLIYDSAETYALPFTRTSLDACVGGSCVGVCAARRLVRRPLPKKRKISSDVELL